VFIYTHLRLQMGLKAVVLTKLSGITGGQS
jgi:hypothetical protein